MDTSKLATSISEINKKIDRIITELGKIDDLEASNKKKIIELGRNAEFKLEFNKNMKLFTLKTLFRQTLKLELNEHLFELRDRALVLFYNKNDASDEKSCADAFITTVDFCEKITNCMNNNYQNGYPSKESYEDIKKRFL